MGIANGNSLILKSLDATTAIATTVQTYPMPGNVDAFEFIKNKTRVLVEMGNTVNLYQYDSSVNPPTLTLLSSATVPGNPGGTWGMCAAPDGSSVHLVGYSLTSIYSFKLTGDTLSYSSTSNAAPLYQTNCKVSPDSKYLVSSGYNEGVKSFSINSSTAALTPVTTYADSGTSWVEFSNDGNFFFAVNQDNSTMKSFEFNSMTGSFTLTDTKTLANSWPDFLDVRSNGSELFVNCQAGFVIHLPFDRTTKTFGIETNIATPHDWFTVGETEPIYFQYDYATGDTTIYTLDSTGSLDVAGSHLTDETLFQII